MSRRPATLVDVAPFTLGTIAICIVIFAIMIFKSSGMPGGGSLFSIPVDVLRGYGASWREGVWDGEWYRFVTPLFLHAGLLHIACNMYMLYRLGPGAEIHFGTYRFAFIYLLSGIGGVCLSQMLGGGLAVGASGSICGILGAALAFKAMQCYDWRRALKSSEVRETFFYIVLNLALVGFLLPHVDNWGHVGGLLFGFLYGLLFEYERQHRRQSMVLLAGCVLLTAALIAGCRWMVFNPHYHVHLGLKADAEGQTAEADRHFADAIERARWFRSTNAAYELAPKIYLAYQQGDSARVERYVKVWEAVTPADPFGLGRSTPSSSGHFMDP